MSIYKTWNHAREKGGFNSNPLLRILYRDGVLYFVVRPWVIQPVYLQSNALFHPGHNGCVSECCFGRWLIPKRHLTGIRIFNLICWLIFPVSLMFVGVFILWALIIVMIQRLILNLRDLHSDWGDEAYHTAAGEGDPRRIHTPSAFPNRAQSTSIFVRRTTICDEEFSMVSPPKSTGIVGAHVTYTVERQGRPLDGQWPINLAPLRAKAHTPAYFPPQDLPPKQTQTRVRTTVTTPLTDKDQGLSPDGQFRSPQVTALGYDSQQPLQHHRPSSRVLTPQQHCDSGDET
jgi:hypothetical protein